MIVLLGDDLMLKTGKSLNLIPLNNLLGVSLVGNNVCLLEQIIYYHT